jgi:hypothetical protein
MHMPWTFTGLHKWLTLLFIDESSNLCQASRAVAQRAGLVSMLSAHWTLCTGKATSCVSRGGLCCFGICLSLETHQAAVHSALSLIVSNQTHLQI